MVSFGYSSVSARTKATDSAGGQKSHTCSSAPLPATSRTDSSSTLDKIKNLLERRFKSIIISTSPENIAPTSPMSPRATKKKRRRTIVTDMIGFPQDFTHSSHVGVHEVRQLAYQPRHSARPSLGVLDSSKLPTVFRFSQRETDFPLIGGRDDFMADFDTMRSNDNTCLSSAVLPVRPAEQPKGTNKVKRKSVPIHAIQEVSESTATPQEAQARDLNGHQIQASCLSLEESLKGLFDCSYDRLNQPLIDEKGRPIHVVGGEYMTQTIKANWDKKMAEVARSLRWEDD